MNLKTANPLLAKSGREPSLRSNTAITHTAELVPVDMLSNPSTVI